MHAKLKAGKVGTSIAKKDLAKEVPCYHICSILLEMELVGIMRLAQNIIYPGDNTSRAAQFAALFNFILVLYCHPLELPWCTLVVYKG